MRVLVTGASGFIGQKLCRVLLERGHKVAALCRSSIEADITQLSTYQHIPFTMGELLPKDVITFSPETLVHLAWEGIPDFSERRCVDNLKSQIHFFKQTEYFNQLKKIIGAGTCLEYGAKQGACIENDCIKPNSYFSWAKKTLSEYLWVLSQKKQIALVWFRIFYIYGPGQRNESLIPTLIKSYGSKLAPEIKNPMAVNDFIYIDDVVSAFVKAIEDQNCHGTFNLGSGIKTSVAYVAKIVEQIMQKGSEPKNQCIPKNYDNESSTGMFADITLSKRQFDWSPQISLLEGIQHSIRAAQFNNNG